MANIPTFKLEPYLVTYDPTTGKQLSGNKSDVKKQIRANRKTARKAARKTARKARKDGLVDRTEGTVTRSPIEFLGVVKKPRRPGPSTKRTAASR